MAEYRVGVQRSFLFAFTKYWGYFPGYQGYASFRQYVETRGRHENFLYVKGGVGHAEYEPSDWLNKEKQVFEAPGDYFFGGGGVGRHFNFGVFFLEATAGVKYSAVPKPISNYYERVFYVTGPGAIAEINFNFGFQF